MLDFVLYARERSRSPTFQPQLYILDSSIRTAIICMFHDAPDHITKLTVCNSGIYIVRNGWGVEGAEDYWDLDWDHRPYRNIGRVQPAASPA